MDNELPLFDLADHIYRVLSVQQQNVYLKHILSALVYSAPLDGESSDALEVFGDYQWEPRPGVDSGLFDDLLEKGHSGSMDPGQLDQFMDMVTATGQVHLYFWIRKALGVLKE
ncbi:MAG: hypothetical protein OEY58_19685 [Gammaproteobacteria bacterium]|nr:hypothetical protein [Gammaproteobacteria bacterium]